MIFIGLFVGGGSLILVGGRDREDALVRDLLSVPIKAFVNNQKMNRLGGEVLIESPS